MKSSRASFHESFAKHKLDPVSGALSAIALLAAAPFVEFVTGLTFVIAPAGPFQMGSPRSESGHRPDERSHAVTFSRPFYIGTTEVTQWAWNAVMGTNPSHFHGDDLPVEQVTWNDAQAFITRLNARTGRHFRLPSEAEWEYACRTGSTTAFSFGPHLTSREANFDARQCLGVVRNRILRLRRIVHERIESDSRRQLVLQRG